MDPITFRYEGDDMILRLPPVARAGLNELLELLDLDAFSMAPEDRELLVETKRQIMIATGHPVY